MIKVVVTGAAGKMGRQVCQTVLAGPELRLVGGVDKVSIGTDLGSLVGLKPANVMISDNLEQVLSTTSPDVMVDFTHPTSVMDNIRTAVKCGVHAVIGTTGITEENLAEIRGLCERANVNTFVAPNFALGAVLMMKFSALASKYFPYVEIVELHHNQKADAPSGTAIKTAEMVNAEKATGEENEIVAGARGGEVNRVHIHSVRLPGLVAHQEVIFGGQGQTLTIRHDSIDRTSFMPGVVMAIKAVQNRPGLTYGLENLLEI